MLCIKVAINELLTNTKSLSFFFGNEMIKVSEVDVYLGVLFVK